MTVLLLEVMQSFSVLASSGNYSQLIKDTLFPYNEYFINDFDTAE